MKKTLMDMKTLKHWVAEGESDHLEFKTSWNGLEDACKSLCGFLNGRGGKVLFGVRPNQTPHGVEYTDHTQQVIAQHFKKFDPAPHLRIETLLLETGRFIVALIAEPSYTKVLYQYEGRVFERVGSTKQIMPIAKQQILLLERLDHSGYESLPTSYTLENLDLEQVKRVIKQGITVQRIDPKAEEESIEGLLENRFSLMKEGQLLHGALILFGKKMTRYTQCLLKVIAYRSSTEDDHHILDSAQIYGNIFTLLMEAQTFVNRFTSVKPMFDANQIRRTDIPQIPPLAIREILVNALMHRDYSANNGYVSVKMFSDRLEVWNSGSLSSDLHIEDLKKSHPSKPRNPNIARMLYCDHLVENWGKGTNRILTLCHENQMPEPFYLRNFVAGLR